MARCHANALSTKAAQSRTVLRPTHYRSNPITRYHQSSRSPATRRVYANPITRYPQTARSPATRRVYASLFRAPQWHGAAQMYFPPRPRKSAWHCDIADIIRHTVCPHTRSNPIAGYRQSSRSPATRRVYASMALRHHRRNSPHGLPTHWKQSSSEKLFPVLHLHYKLATSQSSSEKLFPVLQVHYKLARSESSSEKLFPALHLHYKLATSQSSSERLFPVLHLYYKLASQV